MEPTPVPRRVLRPGLQVVRRDDRHLQVGLDAPQRLIVRDRPDVRRVLGLLASGGASVADTAAAQRVVEQLSARGMLVGADLLDAALDRAAAIGAEPAVRACFARHGDAAASRLAARAAARVVLDAAREPAAAATRLLTSAGIGTVVPRDASPTGRPPDADVALVVAGGEPARERLDTFVRAAVPHLLLTADAARVTLGPLVVPGVTACVRCLDAHRGERDPRRATVLEQCRRGSDGTGDPVLLAAGLAAAVADVVGLVDGDRPATWSATLALDGGPPAVRAWTRHPHCGCAWDALSATG